MSESGTPLPKAGKPATAAVQNAGVHSLEDLTRFTEAELLALHGVGPKAIRIWKDALAARGLSLAERAK
jgi:DNA-directed RNA polymerase alpha subunit